MSTPAEPTPPGKGQFLVYPAEDGKTRIEVRLEGETVWLTQQHMADLFQTTQQNISLHLQNIYDEGELQRVATHKEYLSVRQEGSRQVNRSLDFYNLDAIISVGYRVKSAVATRFRIWATQQLREYIVKGFVLDDERLKNPENNQPLITEQALGAPRPLGTPSACSEDKQDVQKPRGWYRRQLPHCDQPGLIQFITYRLADSIPSAILTEIENELRVIPPEHMAMERRRKIESMLDQGHGSGVLREPAAAKCIIENWQHFHGTRYTLLAWVVMPTHVHVLIQLFEGVSLPNVVQSWKSYTGKRLKALFPHACVAGEFWIRESWDRYIRDEKHFLAALDYIRQNPVKAKLVTTPEEWPHTGTTLLGPPSACSEISKPPITEQALGAPRPLGTPSACSEISEIPKPPITEQALGAPRNPSACSEQRQTATSTANVAGIVGA